MKKRIFSFLLVMAMVAALFALPISATTVSDSYSFDFEDSDIRNYVDGQVFDVAAKGEAETAPAVDGTIGKNEYSVSGKFTKFSGSGNTPAELPVHMSVKDGYLYLAFIVEDATAQKDIQFDIGVAQWNTGDSAYSRLRYNWKANDSLGNNSALFWAYGSSDTVKGINTTSAANVIVDKKFSSGVYEVKFSLFDVYRLFAGSARGINVYNCPCVTLGLWYDVSTSNQYVLGVQKGLKHNSTLGINWVPYTILIPNESLLKIKDTAGQIGELGTDWRNAVEGQLATLDDYTDTAPTVDGVVNENEYTVQNHVIQHTHKGKQNGFSDITASYSVTDDGYFYAAFSYAESTHSPAYIQYGLMANNGASAVTRSSATVKTDGSFEFQGLLLRNALDPDNWISGINEDRKKETLAITECSTSHNDGITTYEIKISIETMIATYELTGWEASDANCVHFILFPQKNGNYQISYVVPTATINTLKLNCGISYTTGYTEPTIALPKGCVDTFSPHVHFWGKGEETKKATHLEEGSILYTCECGETKTVTVAKVSEHNHATVETIDSNKHKKICECGDVIEENHNWDNGTVTKEATHLEEGSKNCTCKDCGEEATIVIPKSTVHKYGDWEKHDAKEHKQTCACDSVKYEDHKWDAGNVTKEATVDSEGTIVYTCTVCGYTKTDSIPKLVPPATDPVTPTATTDSTTATQQATTEAPAEEKKGCKGSIGLSAVAIVPMLCTALLIGKRKDD